MRILLLADIHANWAALSAIREPFDQCFFLGDLVEYGTDPNPCIQWVREHATVAIRGNHDHATAQHVPSSGGSGLRRLSGATREWNHQTILPTHLKYLSRLPVTAHTIVEDLRFEFVHATPRDPMDEYLSADADAWAVRLQNTKAHFVCVGHTHLPMHLTLPPRREGEPPLQIVNPGSVGQPRDGDPRAAYAVIEDGRVELKRVEYDIDAAVRQIRTSTIPADLMDMAEQFLRTGGQTA